MSNSRDAGAAFIAAFILGVVLAFIATLMAFLIGVESEALLTDIFRVVFWITGALYLVYVAIDWLKNPYR